jgi:hypothetical protein
MSSAINLQTDYSDADTNPNDWEVVTITGEQLHSPSWPNRWGLYHLTSDWHVSPGGVHVKWGSLAAEYPDEGSAEGGELLFAAGALVTLGDWVDLGNVYPTLGDGTVIGEQSSCYSGALAYYEWVEEPAGNNRPLWGERLVMGGFCQIGTDAWCSFGDDVTLGSYVRFIGNGFDVQEGVTIGPSWTICEDTDIGAGSWLGRYEVE